MTNDRSLLGRPIAGDYTRYNERGQVEQYSAEKFLVMLDAIFAADERVTALGWRQYTDYFNDGEPCYFGVHGEDILAVNRVPVDVGWEHFVFEEGTDEYDEENEADTLSLGDLRPAGDWGYDENKRWGFIATEPSTPLYDAASAFYKALGAGNFDNVILDAFGDPATVLATREGFTIEYCEHD